MVRSIGNTITSRNETIEKSQNGLGNSLDSTSFVYTSVGKLSYTRSQILGRGGFGTVFHGFIEGQPIAVKRIELFTSTNQENTNDFHEFELQMALKHDNVLAILTWEQDEDFRYIGMELCFGTLENFIEKDKAQLYKGPALPEDRLVLYEIADGFNYIHSQNIIHRNIKPENILISIHGRIKISDFGLSKKINSQENLSNMSGVKGTRLWMAPEIISTGGQLTSFKSDVFSAGCVFFNFLTRGIHPFGTGHCTILNNIKNGDPVNIDELTNYFLGAQSIIGKMIMHEPQTRPFFLQVKQELEIF